MDPQTDPQHPPLSLPASESEEMLDTEDKIELNAFLERKGWIEDKCAVLESMPPIEVFAGLAELLSDPNSIPSSLPTRQQLADWLAEHDSIEKETEMFDSGDMIRLKKFAKAATEKHLSPEDTDLIEVTLNTLLALDKLLHLLRARSDTLDLLGLRLTWEEQRIGARKERHKLIDDLRVFLISRARWSPAAYDALATSIANGSSGSIADTAVLNRSARYKHTELLSHDAAQFTGRVIALRNSFVNPAGKTLDKLIEASTQGPVPDQILDEQDRIEDQCMNELEGLGKFAINTVMQWKRADELYGELKKDQLTAQALESDIRSAILSHPTLKLDLGFSSRVQALTRRLQLIGDPKSHSSSFPRPIHPLFPDQHASNDSIATLLSDELRFSLRLVRNLEDMVRRYHSSLVAVQRVEAARAKMSEATKHLAEFTKFLTEGDTSQSNGLPPNLDGLSCLDPVAYSSFLAILPTWTSRLPSLETAASKALHETESSLMTLPSRGIDSSFRSETSDEKECLISARSAAVHANARVKVVVADMKAVRGIWSAIGDVASDLDTLQEDTIIALTHQRYRGQLSSNGAPLTPESPNANLPQPRVNHADVMARLEIVRKRIDGEVQSSLRQVLPRLPSVLSGYLETTACSLEDMAFGMHSLGDLLNLVSRQARAMEHIHEEVQSLEQGIEAVKGQIERAETEILDKPDATHLQSIQNIQESLVAEQRQIIQAFTDGLTARVLLVNRPEVVTTSIAKALSSFNNDQIPRSRTRRLSMSVALPDLAALDSSIRTDANGLAINLSGSLLSLERCFERLKVAVLAISTDTVLDPWVTRVQKVEHGLLELKQSLDVLFGIQPDETLLPTLNEIKERAAVLLQRHRSEIGLERSSVRDAVCQLQAAANVLQYVSQEDFVVRRIRAFESTVNRLDAFDEGMTSLHERIGRALASEIQRLQEIEDIRIQQQEEEQRRLLEERLRQEEARRQEERILDEKQERLRKEDEGRLLREAEAEACEQGERLRREEKARTEEEQRLRIGEQARKREEEEQAAQLLKQARIFAEAEEQVALQLDEDRIRMDASRLQREEEERLRAEEQDRVVELGWDQQREVDRYAVVDPEGSTSSETAPFDPVAHWAAQLRARLSALRIVEMVIPRVDSNLPSHETVERTLKEYAVLVVDINALLSGNPDTSNGELTSLRKEKARCASLLPRLTLIGDLAHHILLCDNALSDLLEHIDFYPVAPFKHLAATHRSDPLQTSQEQLSARISFTKQAVEDMQSDFNPIADDSRAASERDRILQTWNELHDMGMDRLAGNRSRAPSVTDSVYSATSNVSRLMGPPALPRSRTTSTLSAKPSKTNTGLLATPRRASKGAIDSLSRPASKMSTRSVSGPLASNSSLFNSTFSSRQRTSSLSSKPTSTPQKAREQSPVLVPSSARVHRVASPSPSLTSSGRQSRGSPRSTFARAPRFSLDGQSGQKAKRKPYVANTKSKLDVAIGEVVNKLPEEMAIHIEPITWKDTSGKYWIGDADPKLCFCRILRSQTVMVRVGGGWMELSRFVKNHFTNVYRIGSEAASDSRPSQEEKWISSASLLQTLERPVEETWQPPRTPEPRTPHHVPSFSLSTPNGTSPRSLPSSGSSPLTPLQFMRRAEEHLVVPPATPAKTPKRGMPSTPARAAIWRP